MPDYKHLCAELADSIELLLEMRPVEAKPLRITEDRLARARAALAEPELEGPTDDEVDDLRAEHSLCYEDSDRLDCLVLSSLMLARWGNHPGSPDSSNLDQ